MRIREGWLSYVAPQKPLLYTLFFFSEVYYGYGTTGFSSLAPVTLHLDCEAESSDDLFGEA